MSITLLVAINSPPIHLNLPTFRLISGLKHAARSGSHHVGQGYGSGLTRSCIPAYHLFMAPPQTSSSKPKFSVTGNEKILDSFITDLMKEFRGVEVYDGSGKFKAARAHEKGLLDGGLLDRKTAPNLNATQPPNDIVIDLSNGWIEVSRGNERQRLPIGNVESFGQMDLLFRRVFQIIRRMMHMVQLARPMPGRS